MPRPKADRIARRAELTAAAARAFAKHGVAATSVSDIVSEAGVAKGTFYLYFESKGDALLEVVDLIAEDLLASIKKTVGGGRTAPEKLLAFRDTLIAVESQPEIEQIADFMHRPENHPLHDRLDERITPRLAELVEKIVRQGVAEDAFHVADPRAAAWFVLGGLRSVELSGTTHEKLPAATAAVTDLALRALGCDATEEAET